MSLLNSLSKLLSQNSSGPCKNPMRLEGERTLAISGAQAVCVTVLTGALWLTRTGQEADVVLRAGQKLTLPGGQKLVLQGIPAAEIEICPRS